MSTARRFDSALSVRVFAAHHQRLPAGTWSERGVHSPYWRLYCNDNAGATVTSGSQTYELLPGRVMLIPADVLFSFHNDADVGHFYVHFDVAGLPQQLMEVAFGGVIVLPEGSGRGVRAVRRRLGSSTGGGLADACLVQSLVLECLAAALDLAGTRTDAVSVDMALMPAVAYINSNLDAVITNRKLARLCHMSEDHFIRKFRDALGRTPAQYVRHRRLAEAAQLLLFTDRTIQQIAAATGFGSRHSFSRVFATAIGTPPAAFRRRGQP